MSTFSGDQNAAAHREVPIGESHQTGGQRCGHVVDRAKRVVEVLQHRATHDVIELRVASPEVTWFPPNRPHSRAP